MWTWMLVPVEVLSRLGVVVVVMFVLLFLIVVDDGWFYLFICCLLDGFRMRLYWV